MGHPASSKKAKLNGFYRQHLDKVAVFRRVHPVHRIGARIRVTVKTDRVLVAPRMRVPSPETPCAGVEVTGAEVVQAQVRVALFARKEVIGLRRGVAGDEGADGVVQV